MFTIAQKKDLQIKCGDIKDAPSSNENKTPPIGAPNAAATPAAAPQATKSRTSLSVKKSRFWPALDIVEPMIAPLT